MSTVQELFHDPENGPRYRKMHATDKEAFESLISRKLQPFLGHVYGTAPDTPSVELFQDPESGGACVVVLIALLLSVDSVLVSLSPTPYSPPTLPKGVTYGLLDSSRRHFHRLIGNVAEAPEDSGDGDEEHAKMLDPSLPEVSLRRDALKMSKDIKEEHFGDDFEYFPLAFMVDGEEGEPWVFGGMEHIA